MKESNTNYEEKVQELEKHGGIEEATDILVPLVTNRDRYKNAPKHLPMYLLIRGKKILVLKKKASILKYSNPNTDMTSLVLYEPWRNPEDMNNLETDEVIVKNAKGRRKEVFCNSIDFPDN